MPIDPPADAQTPGLGLNLHGCIVPRCDGHAPISPEIANTVLVDDDYEPILALSRRRFVVYPVNFVELWVLYKQALTLTWRVDAFSMDADINDWANKLTPGERHFVSTVLAVFIVESGVLYDITVKMLALEVQIPEARCFYGLQANVESVHQEACSYIMRTLIVEPLQCQYLFRALDDVPCLQQKSAWLSRWCKDSTPFRLRLVAVAAMQSIICSSALAGLFCLAGRDVLPGSSVCNRFMSRDRALHADFACKLFRQLRLRPCVHVVHAIVREAVEIEKDLCTEYLPVGLIGVDCRLMCGYVEFRADKLLQALGYERMYFACNPFAFEDFAIAGLPELL